MSDELQRLCIGCAHHVQDQMVGTWYVPATHGACLHPWNASPVDGDPEMGLSELRRHPTRCGHDGRWHEAGVHPEVLRLRAGRAVFDAKRMAGWNPIPQPVRWRP
jgi:hypothetical protein